MKLAPPEDSKAPPEERKQPAKPVVIAPAEVRIIQLMPIRRPALASAEERISGGRAVVRFPVAERAMAPYFFRASEAGWQLDLESMHRLIRFNHLNQWHFTENGHEFMFAFADHSVDANGYVH